MKHPPSKHQYHLQSKSCRKMQKQCLMDANEALITIIINDSSGANLPPPSLPTRWINPIVKTGGKSLAERSLRRFDCRKCIPCVKVRVSHGQCQSTAGSRARHSSKLSQRFHLPRQISPIHSRLKFPSFFSNSECNYTDIICATECELPPRPFQYRPTLTGLIA